MNAGASQFRHSSMERWNPGRMDVSGSILANLMPAIHAGVTNSDFPSFVGDRKILKHSTLPVKLLHKAVPNELVHNRRIGKSFQGDSFLSHCFQDGTNRLRFYPGRSFDVFDRIIA
jgi:hypothetical protein